MERRTVRGDSKARGGRRGVRPVPLAIERVGIRVRNEGIARPARVVAVTDEIEPAGDLRVREGRGPDRRAVVGGVVRGVARSAEIGVVVVDPGVDDADLHRPTGQAAHGGPGRRHTRVRVAGHVGEVVHRHGYHLLNARQCADPGQVWDRHPDLDAVVGILIPAQDPGAHGGQGRRQGVLSRAELRAEECLAQGGQAPAGLTGRRLAERDRRSGQLDDYRRLASGIQGDG